MLEAPGEYGCALAIGEGQGAGNYQAYGGPHYGFLAARKEYVRRMPGRIVGETTDVDGERGYVLTLQTREQHIRREKATLEHHHEPDAARARRARAPLVARAAGPARGGGDAASRSRLREGAAGAAARLFPEQATFKEFAVRVGRPRRGSRPRSARARASTRATRSAATTPGLDDALLVGVTEKRTPADIDRLAEVLAGGRA